MVVTARAVASGILRRAASACVDAVVVGIVGVGARDGAVVARAVENSSAMCPSARGGRARYGWS